jgi:hypothetical protein
MTLTNVAASYADNKITATGTAAPGANVLVRVLVNAVIPAEYVEDAQWIYENYDTLKLTAAGSEEREDPGTFEIEVAVVGDAPYSVVVCTNNKFEVRTIPVTNTDTVGGAATVPTPP